MKIKNLSSYLLCLIVGITLINPSTKAFAVVNQNPNAPVITGPTTRDVNQNGTYSFTATDPDGDLLQYQIDWDNNGIVDQTLPAGVPPMNYVTSGTSQSQANNWAGAGTKTFRARTVDGPGGISSWTSYSVTVSCLAGTYSAPGSCSACIPGYYCDGPSIPVSCPVNTYCTGGNTPSAPGATNPPTPCETGKSSPTRSTNSGACVVVTATLTASPSSCSVATGTSTCNSTLTWTTGGSPFSTSSITTNVPTSNTIVYTANSGSQVTKIPYNAGVNVPYYLYNNAVPLASTAVTVSCAAGTTNWDTIGSVCANPSVGSAVVTGDYYANPATLNFTCLLSDRYQITRTTPGGTVITISSGPYTGAASTSLSVQDNYKVICKHGSVEASQTFLYHYPAPEPTVSIDAHPKTTGSEGSSLISWSIPFPTLSCTLTATPVCANNLCSDAQVAAAAALNTVITSTNTDLNDPQTSRPISTSINTIAPGHETSDYKALGRKTLVVTKTTDFTIDCGNGKKATTRIRVARNSEQ